MFERQISEEDVLRVLTNGEVMKCVICKQGETSLAKATITLERGSTTIVIKGVPADVCANCGEEYVDQQTTSRLLKEADEAVRSGVQVDIRQYKAA